jgi:penicillin-binding protein 2
MASAFGLGQVTGLDLEGEKPGLVPTPDWKRARLRESWFDGDTAQLSMGQSFLLTTPLQMASVTAALANRGTVWRPYLVQKIASADGTPIHDRRPEIARQVRVPAEQMEFVRQAMLAVVQAPDGTGRRAAIEGVAVAGKTGTAEFDELVDGQRRRIKRTWFIAFAPFEAPTVALAVMFEDGDSGGGTVAPVVGHILAGIFNSKVGNLISDRGLHAD